MALYKFSTGDDNVSACSGHRREGLNMQTCTCFCSCSMTDVLGLQQLYYWWQQWKVFFVWTKIVLGFGSFLANYLRAHQRNPTTPGERSLLWWWKGWDQSVLIHFVFSDLLVQICSSFCIVQGQNLCCHGCVPKIPKVAFTTFMSKFLFERLSTKKMIFHREKYRNGV